ncbi:Vinculin [Fasciola gigantica]|uniref:Vinculin n=1 Tax=Fasciola gigantica TaxID=46835 RepID=A0A504YLI9_FASGI|nr:Vinculin [Fasciola gigantica]
MQLAKLCNDLTSRGDRHNPVFRLARTLEGKLIQAQRWLADPRGPQRQVGLEACRSLAQGARNLLDLDSVRSPKGRESSDLGTVNGSDVEKVSKDSCVEACEHVERAAERLFTISAQPDSKCFSSNFVGSLQNRYQRIAYCHSCLS